MQIVTFDDDKAILQEHVPYEVTVPRFGNQQHTDLLVHSVVSFLGRPQLISSFPWPASTGRSVNLLKFSRGGLYIPSDVFTPMIRNKLDGFTSFKATCVLKLQINSQPFQCGRLIMGAVPLPEILGNRKNFVFSHVGNLQNVNHVQMDIAKQTEVELRVPFISPYNSFDLIEGKYDWAEVQIQVYSQLNAVDGSCMQCLLWAHFEDIEMGSPTSGVVAPLPKVIQQPIAMQQSNPESSRKKESLGTVSGTLSKLGTVALSKGLSMLRPATRVGDFVADALGWSKPIVSQPNQVVLNRTTEGFQNADGVDQSLVLALSGGNAVDSYLNLTGSKGDETSFDYLKRIPQFIGGFSYSRDASTCTNGAYFLWECAVSPTYNLPACYYARPEADPANGYTDTYKLVWKQPTTLNYICSPFLYWTGSLVYTFRFVKTDYHSGRVEVSFHPFVKNVDSNRMEYVYKTIIDLRENSEVSITVPYIAPQPWKRISTYFDPVNPQPPDPGREMDVMTGVLYVRALTPLLCANTIIANTIECLVEVRAGDDFEVQAPVTSKYLPFSIQNPVAKQQSGVVLSKQTEYFRRDFNRDQKPAGFAIAMKQHYMLLNVRIDTYLNKTITANINAWMYLSINGTQIVVPQFGQANANFETELVFQGSPGDIVKVEIPTVYSSSSTSDTVRWQLFFRISHYEMADVLPASGIVKIDPTQLPLPIATEGGEISVKQPILVKLDSEQIPLPTTGGGGGSDMITINPESLPLWTTPYKVAIQQSRSDPAKQAATAGVVETRTTAVEGWLPPSITGMRKDVSRPSTVNYCAGEVFSSFRQLAKRFAFCLVNSVTSSQSFYLLPVELIRPGALNVRNVNDEGKAQLCLYTPQTKSEVSGSPLSFVAGMYAFYRGSLRCKVWIDPQGNQIDIVSGHIEYARQSNDINIIADNIENFMTPIGYEMPILKKIAEYQVPYYSPTLISTIWSHGVENQFDTPLTNLVISIPSGASTTPSQVKIAVAAADDMDFQIFIGPPPVIHIDNMPTTSRPIHYPPSGFTPTQNVVLDPENTEKPAKAFVPVKWSEITVQGNISGNSCAQDPKF